MGAALGWGVVAASSLVLGMLLGLARSWPSRLIGLVLAFGPAHSSVRRMGTVKDTGSGTALALGALLDGIPEQTVLGLAGGQGVSVGLILAIFVSNLPEAIGSAA
jgi:ZIP family zinc transporter